MVGLHPIVDDSPLFQEPVYPHDGSHISCKVSPTGSDGEIVIRVQPEAVNDEVTIGHVSRGR